jgi:DNA-binding Lrp family transcriptional regulator
MVQDGFPVTSRPYQILSERLLKEANLTISEDEVFSRVNFLREKGFIRRLGAIFNAGPLGYHSTLCAIKVPEPLLEEIAALINSRPEVTHNYVRDHEYNVWFTFGHDEPRQLEDFLDQLRNVSGLSDVLVLPAKKVYKIKAVFTLPI